MFLISFVEVVVTFLHSFFLIFFRLDRHADGSIRFWDASAGTLQVLYKLKTSKVFEKPQSRSIDGSDDDPLAIQLISLCPESRKLCVAGASSHVILFKFRKQECTSDTTVSTSLLRLHDKFLGTFLVRHLF